MAQTEVDVGSSENAGDGDKLRASWVIFNLLVDAINSAPVYANNAAALVGGLTAGDIYKTASTGDAALMIVNAT